MRALVLVLAFVLAAGADAWARGPAKSAAERARVAFDDGRYAPAAKLYAQALVELGSDVGGQREQEVRERLAVALYLSKQPAEARNAFATLCTRFSYAINPDRMAPDVVEFAYTVPACQPVPVAELPKSVVKEKIGPASTQAASAPVTSAPVVSSPSSAITAAPVLQTPVQAPRRIQASPPPSPPRWHWYYLAPLGIGQYLAKSPARGVILTVLELGFAAMNVTGAVLIGAERVPGGFVKSVSNAQRDQLIMDIGFCGLIASALFGVIDGAALEP